VRPKVSFPIELVLGGGFALLLGADDHAEDVPQVIRGDVPDGNPDSGLGPPVDLVRTVRGGHGVDHPLCPDGATMMNGSFKVPAVVAKACSGHAGGFRAEAAGNGGFALDHVVPFSRSILDKIS